MVPSTSNTEQVMHVLEAPSGKHIWSLDFSLHKRLFSHPVSSNPHRSIAYIGFLIHAFLIAPQERQPIRGRHRKRQFQTQPDSNLSSILFTFCLSSWLSFSQPLEISIISTIDPVKSVWFSVLTLAEQYKHPSLGSFLISLSESEMIFEVLSRKKR